MFSNEIRKTFVKIDLATKRSGFRTRYLKTISIFFTIYVKLLVISHVD